MIINEQQWQRAIAQIEDLRTRSLQRLLSGKCSEKEYGNICGLVEGLETFEYVLKESRNPPKKNLEEVEEYIN